MGIYRPRELAYSIIVENNKARKSMRYKMTGFQINALPKSENKDGYVFTAFNDKISYYQRLH